MTDEFFTIERGFDGIIKFKVLFGKARKFINFKFMGNHIGFCFMLVSLLGFFPTCKNPTGKLSRPANDLDSLDETIEVENSYETFVEENESFRLSVKLPNAPGVDTFACHVSGNVQPFTSELKDKLIVELRNEDSNGLNKEKCVYTFKLNEEGEFIGQWISVGRYEVVVVYKGKDILKLKSGFSIGNFSLIHIDVLN